MKKAIYKVPNGKLLKIFLDADAGKIRSVKITGDFFTYPEENIEKLEMALAGCELSKETLAGKIDEFLRTTPTNFFGLDAESLISTILSAQ
ncbi:hypothetical protein HYW83_04660 [Candidatus Peregrinibacteria bacterium]|nr:hypothetical protein [Candidatus Peregrinibacteria bacterium]